MDQDDKEKGSSDSLVADWMKSVTDFWLSAGKTWQAGAFNVPTGPQAPASGYAGRMQEGWQALLKTWQTSASSLSSPQTLEAILKGANALPETTLRILRTTWEGYFKLYEMWLKNLGKVGEASRAYSFEGVEQDVFKEWTEFYEKEIQAILKAPQVGLARFYQERANAAMDKFTRFQVATAEFLHMLSLPVEKSLRVMEEKLGEIAKEGKLSENFKDYYNMWIKILEGHYMTLYQSPEYVQALGKTVKAIDEYKAAREEVFMDIFQSLPIPMRRDMDQLYKEFYVLKKTVKEMANKAKKLESVT